MQCSSSTCSTLCTSPSIAAVLLLLLLTTPHSTFALLSHTAPHSKYHALKHVLCLPSLHSLQNATFTAQAYSAVAASTASATNGTSSSSSSSSSEVPHLVLMLCHALLQRGEELEAQLAAVVRLLAGSRHAQLLPVMLAGAMAGVFRPAEFNR
jgi:hypothetical protein